MLTTQRKVIDFFRMYEPFFGKEIHELPTYNLKEGQRICNITNCSIYEWNGKEWKRLYSILDGLQEWLIKVYGDKIFD